MPTPFDHNALKSLFGLQASDGLEAIRDLMIGEKPFFGLENLDSVRKSGVARLLIQWFMYKPAIISVHEKGIWGPSEIPEIYDRIRQSQGFDVTVDTYPGELVESGESSYLLCLIACALFSNWDFSVVTPDLTITLYVSQEDAVWIDAKDPITRQEMHDSLIFLGLPLHEQSELG